jgi:hypothetical protein
MTDLDLNESICPQDDKPVIYFDRYCDVVSFAHAVPSASANIAYFEPGLQKWALVEDA